MPVARAKTTQPNRREEFELRLLDQFITTLRGPQPAVPEVFAETEIRFGILADHAVYDGCLLLHAAHRVRRGEGQTWRPAETDSFEGTRLGTTDRRLLDRLTPFERRDLDSRLGPLWRVALPASALPGLAPDLFGQGRVQWLDALDRPPPRWLPSTVTHRVRFRHRHEADRAVFEVVTDDTTEPLGFVDGFVVSREGIERADCDGDAARLAQYLIERGPLEVERANEDRMLRSVTRLIGTRGLESPSATLRTGVEPTPHAYLQGAAWLAAPTEGTQLRLQLLFDYDGNRVPADDPTDPLRIDGTWVSRSAIAEQAALDLLLASGAELPAGRGGLEGGLAIPRPAAPGLLRAMLDAGFVVEAEHRRLRSSSSNGISVRSGIDWFDVTAEIEIDSAGTLQLQDILSRLESGTNLVRLDDGTYGMLPEQWLRGFDALAAMAVEGDNGGLRIRQTQAWLIDWLLAERDADTVTLDRQFAERRKRLEAFRSVRAVREQEGFGATLAGLPANGARPPGILARPRFGRLPRRRYGHRQDHAGTGHARSPLPPQAPKQGLGGARWTDVDCRATIFGSPLAGRSRPVCSAPALCRLQRTGPLAWCRAADRGVTGAAVRRIRHPGHDLRSRSAGRHRPASLPVRLRDSRRGPSDQERAQPGRQERALAKTPNTDWP